MGIQSQVGEGGIFELGHCGMAGMKAEVECWISVDRKISHLSGGLECYFIVLNKPECIYIMIGRGSPKQRERI